MNRPHLLAIDDDPNRYDGLRRILGERVALSVACCPACVNQLLPGVDAVLLDHDISGEPCSCGQWSVEEWTRAYVPLITQSGLPVIVTSASDPANRAWLTRALKDAGVRVVQHSANEIQPEHHWIGLLWAWGVL